MTAKTNVNGTCGSGAVTTALSRQLKIRPYTPSHARSSTAKSSQGSIRQRHDVKCSVFQRLFGSKQALKEEKQLEKPLEFSQEELPFPADMLDGTHLQGRPLARAYKASVHGWSALQFHAKCDMKGPCIVYGTTTAGVRFGGFNSVGFSSSDDYASSSKAFLFCWPDALSKPVILRKVGGTEAALFDYARGGPQWGADALVIGPPQAPVMGGISGPDSPTLGAGDLHTAKCRLGLAYEKLPAKLKQTSLFGDSNKADLAEVEVYFCPEIAALY